MADEMTTDYYAPISPERVMITAGCNQAFCIAATSLAAPGDEIIVAVPFYFNHVMWCQAQGIRPVLLPVESDGQPDPARAEALITERTRAVLLVTPGNPTGVSIEPDRIAAFHALAKQRGLALVVDETYRNFRSQTDPAHHEFQDPEWDKTFVSLHSFSKDLAIPGYRVGALVCGPSLRDEAAKILDCVAISAPRIGQEAALTGLHAAGDWRAEQVARVATAHQAFREVMAGQPGGFELVFSGAFFGWVRHPFAGTSDSDVVRELILEHDVLAIPGSAFTPRDEGYLRFSFANLGASAFDDLAERLAAVRL